MAEETKSETVQITKDMTIGDVVQKFPETVDVMLKHGLHCIGCSVNPYETIEQGIIGHGMDNKKLEEMIEEMNKVVAEKASQPQVELKDVSLTEAAAAKLKEVMVQEKKENAGLRIAAVAGGCAGYQYGMDFQDKPEADDVVFEEHGVKIFVDKESRQILKGIVIDYVETLQGAGFKIENPNAKRSCG